MTTNKGTKLLQRFLCLLLALVLLIPAVPAYALTDEQQEIAAAQKAISTAMRQFKGTNETTEQKFLAAAQAALPAGSKVTVTSAGDFKIDVPANEERDGSMSCTLILTCGSEQFVLRQGASVAQIVSGNTAQLEEDRLAMSKAMHAMTYTNKTTKEEMLEVALAARKYNTTAKWTKFTKKNATFEADGEVTGYLTLTLNNETSELRLHDTIPMLKRTMPTKAISINKEEWDILRLTNIERYKDGKTLLTMPKELQRACDVRARENINNTQKAHIRPDGTLFSTAVQGTFRRFGLGENLYHEAKIDVVAKRAVNAWMNSSGHRANMLSSAYSYMGVGVCENQSVQIFSKKSNPITSWTTSTGKKTFEDEEAMCKAYLICKDASGLKSYVPLDPECMTKVKGGYKMKLNSKLTIKVKIKQEQTSTFTDVPTNAAYAKPVAWAVDKRIMTGINQTEFAPDQTCTRGEVFNCMYLANGSPAAAGKNWWSDVKASDFYYKAVLWAKSQDIIDYGSFHGEDLCPRGYALYYVWKSVGSPTVSGKSTFTDVTDSVFYSDAVAWAQQKGMFKGNTDNQFHPDYGCTRADIATYLYYAYGGK